MINNAIPQTGNPFGASFPSRPVLANPFRAVKNDISVREPVAELLPACVSRATCLTPSAQVLTIVGFAEMTAANCNQFRKAACAAWNGHTDVEIDLSQTTFIDCAGLSALIAVRNLTQGRNGVARLMNPSSSILQMLDLTRTGLLFEIVNASDTDSAFAVHHN